MRLDSERWRSPVAIAHRGSRLLWPENTDLAFQSVYDLGYRHLETDLHQTADGILVCFHDPTVDRTTNASGRVAEFTLADLQALDAGYRHATDDGFAFRGAGATVPTLEWLLTTFADTSIVLDMKADGVVAPLAALLDELEAHERVIVGSFSDDRLAEFRSASSGRVATSVGEKGARLWLLATRVSRSPRGETSALQLPAHSRGLRVVDEKLVGVAHDLGLAVHVWTVNSPSEMSRLLDMGVDGVITDRVDLLKEILLERGQW